MSLGKNYLSSLQVRKVGWGWIERRGGFSIKLMMLKLRALPMPQAAALAAYGGLLAVAWDCPSRNTSTSTCAPANLPLVDLHEHLDTISDSKKRCCSLKSRRKVLRKDAYWIPEERGQLLLRQLWKPGQERSKEQASPRPALGWEAPSEILQRKLQMQHSQDDVLKQKTHFQIITNFYHPGWRKNKCSL